MTHARIARCKAARRGRRSSAGDDPARLCWAPSLAHGNRQATARRPFHSFRCPRSPSQQKARPIPPNQSTHPQPSPPRLNPHRARCTVGAPPARDFVPWRFSDGRPSARVDSPTSRRPRNLHTSRLMHRSKSRYRVAGFHHDARQGILSFKPAPSAADTGLGGSYILWALWFHPPREEKLFDLMSRDRFAQ